MTLIRALAGALATAAAVIGLAALVAAALVAGPWLAIMVIG